MRFLFRFLVSFLTNLFWKGSNDVPPNVHAGRRFLASLLCHAIEDGKIEVPPNREDLLARLQVSTTKKKAFGEYIRWRKFSNLDKTSDDELFKFLLPMYKDKFSRIVRNRLGVPVWNVMGCNQTNSDYDVVVQITDAQKPLYPDEEETFVKHFRTAQVTSIYLFCMFALFVTQCIAAYVGCMTFETVLWTLVAFEFLAFRICTAPLLYDSDRPLDVHYISFKDGTFQTNSGGHDTRNIIYHTYGLHTQLHPCLITRKDLVKVDASDKLIALSKFIYEKAETMMGDAYTGFRAERQKTFNDIEKRTLLSIAVLEQFDTTQHWGIWKSIVMKIVQTFLCAHDSNYHLHPEHYRKDTLGRRFGTFYPALEEDVLDCLLYRTRVKGFPDELLPELQKICTALFQEHFPRFSTEFQCPNVSECNPSSLPYNLYNAFLLRPDVSTDEFAELFKNNYGEDLSINKHFVSDCENMEMFGKYLTLSSRVLSLPQRSAEWLKAYHETYQCGRSGGICTPPSNATWAKQLAVFYNLIRGSVGEQIIHHFVDLCAILGCDSCTVATPGMIVEGGEGSRAFCPDGVARLPDGTLVPLEYKTIYSENGPVIDNGFIREYNLARYQLQGAIQVINQDSEKPLATFGLMVILFISPNEPGNPSAGFDYQMRWVRMDYSQEELYFDSE